MTKLSASLGVALALYCFAALPASAEHSDQLIYEKNDVAAGDGNRAVGQVFQGYGRLPLIFETNFGQSSDEVKFLSRGTGYALFLTSSEAVLLLNGRTKEHPQDESSGLTAKEQKVNSSSSVLRIQLAGANPQPCLEGLERRPGKINYLTGRDPKKWRRGIPTFGKIAYREVYPGIDWIFYGNDAQLECDFAVAPGAEPKSIRLIFEGAQQLEIDKEGNLLLKTGGGEVLFRRPFIYQKQNGDRREIAGRYRLEGTNEVSFELAAYDAQKPLVIDPILSFSTYFGGNSADMGEAIALDKEGNIYVAGLTISSVFPTRNPLQSSKGGTFDAFVAKLTADGSTLMYATYLGGTDSPTGEICHGIAADDSGNAWITGITGSANFPLVNPLQGYGGSEDAFLAKLSADGSAILFSTYLGGRNLDIGNDLAVDRSGNAYVIGATHSPDFPLHNPFQPNCVNCQFSVAEAFVAKFAPNGAVVYSSYYGGHKIDWGYGISVDDSGNAYFTGLTNSTLSFPLVNPFQAVCGGCHLDSMDVFVAKLNPAGTALVYSTYLGGRRDDIGFGIAADASGSAYVTGSTESVNFPTATPFQATKTGRTDAFLTKFNATGGVVYSTYLGGGDTVFCDASQRQDEEQGLGVAVDADGSAYVTGRSCAFNFPSAGEQLPNGGIGSMDAFVAKFNPAGSALVQATRFGGTGRDEAFGIAVDASKNIFLAGSTTSLDFPTANPLQPANGGDAFGSSFDAFVVKLRLCETSKGDLNADGGLTSSDIVMMLNCVFLGSGNCAACFADLNCDGALDATDVITELNAVFLGTPIICPPLGS